MDKSVKVAVFGGLIALAVICISACITLSCMPDITNKWKQNAKINNVKLNLQKLASVEKDTLFVTNSGKLFLFINKTPSGGIRVVAPSGLCQDFSLKEFSELVYEVYPASIGGRQGKIRSVFLQNFYRHKNSVDLSDPFKDT